MFHHQDDSWKVTGSFLGGDWEVMNVQQASPGIPHPKTSQPPLGLISGLGIEKTFRNDRSAKKKF